MGFLSPFFLEHLNKCKGDVFCCRRTYVVWRSFHEIAADTAEKECFEKKEKITTQNITVVPLLRRISVTQRATINSFIVVVVVVVVIVVVVVKM